MLRWRRLYFFLWIATLSPFFKCSFYEGDLAKYSICIAKCANKYGGQEVVVVLSGESTDRFHSENESLSFSLCKVGCMLPHYNGQLSASFRDGQSFSVSAVFIPDTLRSTSAMLLCADVERNKSISGYIGLVNEDMQNRTTEFVVVAVVERQLNEDYESVESVVSTIFTSSRTLSFAVRHRSRSRWLQLRAVTISSEGRTSKERSSRWYSVDELISSSATMNLFVRQQALMNNSVTVTIGWSPTDKPPACSLHVECTSRASFWRKDFKPDMSMSIALSGLHFSNNYTVHIFAWPNSDRNSSILGMLRFSTESCRDLTDDLSLCAPLPVRDIRWEEDADGRLAVVWDYDASTISLRLLFYFVIILHPLFTIQRFECQFLSANRCIVAQHMRSLAVDVSFSYCNYDAEVIVVDSNNRSSSSVFKRRLIPYSLPVDHGNAKVTLFLVSLLSLYVTAVVLFFVWRLMKGHFSRIRIDMRNSIRRAATIRSVPPHSVSVDSEGILARNEEVEKNKRETRATPRRKNSEEDADTSSYSSSGFERTHVMCTETVPQESLAFNGDDFSSYVQLITSSTSDEISSTETIIPRLDGMAASAFERDGSALRQRHSNSLSPTSPSACSLRSPHSFSHSKSVFTDVVLLCDLVVTGRLGTGHFGAVDRVCFKSNARVAALKHVPDGTRGTRRRWSLYKEAQVALDLCTSGHKYIVGLLALCYETCASRKLYGLVYECCEGGDLKRLLKRIYDRIRQLAKDSADIYRPIRNSANIGFPDERPVAGDWRMRLIVLLLKFALQISLAMEYISSRRYVHRDIAARNILLSKCLPMDPFGLADNQTAKIADFGLCVPLGDAEEVILKRKCFVPYKWLPYEFWLHNTYGLEGDVWEFGCLLIELITFGDDPGVIVQCNEVYRPRDDIQQYLSRLSTGFTSFDDILCKSLIPLIGRCINVDKSQRVSFAEISGHLRNFSPRVACIV